ncbi:MAG: DMT family transporter [Candidatus Diapherotrites archaeon]|nr:DMT family transporter [Candidatus Diapherotrites archaeon]
MLDSHKGYFLVLLTAIVSGFSIFLNKFAVADANPFVFTALKNIIVAVFLFSLILLLKDFPAIKSLPRKNWLKLALIGLVGGSIPFLLFFYALQSTAALNAGFIHKSLFVFASLFALVFLKEKLGKKFLAASALLLASNFFLFNLVSQFTAADFLILLAVMLWAAENVISKHALRELSGRTVAFGRMFFGSLFLLAFLAATSQLQFAFEMNTEQFQWLLITAVPLFLYVLTFYSGLKHIPVSHATALLMLGQPVTLLLSMLFFNTALSFNHAIGIVLAVSGITLLFASSFAFSVLRSKGFSFVKH